MWWFRHFFPYSCKPQQTIDAENARICLDRDSGHRVNSSIVLDKGMFFLHALERGVYMWSIISRIRSILTDDRGIGVVEIILILVVLIGLVIIFKSQLTSLVQSIFSKITSESAGI